MTVPGRFLDKPSAEQSTALDALAAVPKGWDRVVAEFAAPRWSKWAENQYGPVRKATWWGWLLHKRQPDWAWRGIPTDDHVEYRERDGQRYRLSQPYGIAWDELQGLVAFCEREGLKASIHGSSWWFPGWTVVVVVEAANQKPSRL